MRNLLLVYMLATITSVSTIAYYPKSQAIDGNKRLYTNYFIQRLHWSKASFAENATKIDTNFDTISVQGNSNEDSNAQIGWPINIGSAKFLKFSVLLDVTGSSLGAGLRSREPSSIPLFLNEKEVYRIFLNKRDRDGYFRHRTSSIGARFFYTGSIDVSELNIAGPELLLTFKIPPNSIMEVHSLEVSAQLTEASDT